MTSENIRYLVGTMLKESHPYEGNPQSHSVWVLVQDCAVTEDAEGKRVYDQDYSYWQVLHSTDLGNLGQTLAWEEFDFSNTEVVGTIPFTPAAEQAAKDAEASPRGDYPRITWGTKPDGSPWAVHVDFGSGVAINSTGQLWDDKRVISTAHADRKSTALRDAMAWVVNDLVSVLEGNKAHQLAKGEEPKCKPKRVRVGVDRSGWMHKHQPSLSHEGLPWVRMDGVGRHTDKGLVELTDADTITVSISNTTAVAAFLDGKLVPARHTDDVAGVDVNGEYIGLWPMSKIWKTEDRFYILRKGATLTIPVAR